MQSSMIITFDDAGKGLGLEPVISLKVNGVSEDPRDRLLKSLFQGGGSFLEIVHTHQDNVATPQGYPEMIKHISLRKISDDEVYQRLSTGSTEYATSGGADGNIAISASNRNNE